jgi:hypothetical protein
VASQVAARAPVCSRAARAPAGSRAASPTSRLLSLGKFMNTRPSGLPASRLGGPGSAARLRPSCGGGGPADFCATERIRQPLLPSQGQGEGGGGEGGGGGGEALSGSGSRRPCRVGWGGGGGRAKAWPGTELSLRGPPDPHGRAATYGRPVAQNSLSLRDSGSGDSLRILCESTSCRSNSHGTRRQALRADCMWHAWPT